MPRRNKTRKSPLQATIQAIEAIRIKVLLLFFMAFSSKKQEFENFHSEHGCPESWKPGQRCHGKADERLDHRSVLSGHCNGFRMRSTTGTSSLRICSPCWCFTIPTRLIILFTLSLRLRVHGFVFFLGRFVLQSVVCQEFVQQESRGTV